MRRMFPIPNDIPSERLPRIPKVRFNWGSEETAGVRIKKINATVYSPADSFGVFLGRELFSGRPCVGVFNEDNLVEFVYSYDSISELQHSWILD